MNTTTIKKTLIASVLAFCFGAVLLLSSCMSPAVETADEQATNRDYMSQVNLIMDELAVNLDAFSEAVSENDIVSMRNQAEKAYKSIDDLEKLETPEALTDIHNEYVDGCKDLKTALNDYVDLYSEIESATEADPFDYDTYDERLKAIKTTYQDGIKHLENADKKATEME